MEYDKKKRKRGRKFLRKIGVKKPMLLMEDASYIHDKKLVNIKANHTNENTPYEASLSPFSCI